MSATKALSAGLPHAPAPYSQGIASGDFIFISGQTGIDHNTGNLPDDFESQARQAFKNVEIILKAAGSSLSKVIKTTIWLTDAANFSRLNELYAEYFPSNAPARSTPIVGLPKEGLLISIEAVASA